ncbi:MAG: phage/plasmid primase, P4 family, partial [Candidatus Nitrosotenuis sp.]|nr:phage/plasmid primase, P4 family [Candidatus Nitrosotenuis sp.]
DDIADRMAKITSLVYLQKEDNFYYWNLKAQVWQNDGMSLLMTLFNKATPRIMPNKPKIFHDCVFQLKLDQVKLPKNFKPNPEKLYFKNAALDLATLDYAEKSKEDNIQIMLDTELDLRAPPPREFLKALQIALPDPQDLYDCLQALSSVLLVRTQRIEKAFFFLGSGGNGKTTIMKVLDNIFKEYISHVDMLDLQKDGFSKTALVDKLANSFSEISKMKQKDVGVFKAIASGDTQSINSKFKDRFDSVIKVIQFYSSNQMPEIEEINEGFIRRAHPIEFNQRILKKDPYIDDKLKQPEECKRILALFVRIARTTKKHGFLFEKTYKEKENTLLKKSNPIHEFLAAGIVKKREGYRIKKKELYRLYQDYCDQNKFGPVGTIMFSKFLTNAGFKYGGRNEDPYWEGLGVPPVTEGQKVL